MSRLGKQTIAKTQKRLASNHFFFSFKLFFIFYSIHANSIPKNTCAFILQGGDDDDDASWPRLDDEEEEEEDEEDDEA